MLLQMGRVTGTQRLFLDKSAKLCHCCILDLLCSAYSRLKSYDLRSDERPRFIRVFAPASAKNKNEASERQEKRARKKRKRRARKKSANSRIFLPLPFNAGSLIQSQKPLCNHVPAVLSWQSCIGVLSFIS